MALSALSGWSLEALDQGRTGSTRDGAGDYVRCFFLNHFWLGGRTFAMAIGLRLRVGSPSEVRASLQDSKRTAGVRRRARNRLASRARRRRDCRPGRARQALRSHTPSARATADRDVSRRPIGCCRIAHRISWHINMDERGTFCERKEISRFGKVLSGRNAP
jgi:hypothetical protein